MGARRSGRGEPVKRGDWPASGAVREWLVFCDQVRQDNGLPSLRALAAAMGLSSASRVSKLLRGPGLPADDKQARDLLAALGATDTEIRRGMRLYKAAQAGHDQVARDAGQPGWWRWSGYVGQVSDIAPLQLLGRQDELEELADWCAGRDEAYAWWQAGPRAGKSALMAWLVLHPPPGAWVISFFVTARLAGQADSTAFTNGLLDQLAAITGDQTPPLTSVAGRERLRRQLLEEAAARAAKDVGQLVLVVDGLDEDCGSLPGSGLASIAACLPKRPPPGLRVIVASRPDPPMAADVDADHPLRSCRIRQLDVSPHATGLMQKAQLELDEVLATDKDRHGGLGYQVLGLVTASGGGLGHRDLQQLTSRPAFEIDRLLHGVFGRTIAGRADPHATARVFLFTHETLREQAIGRLGPDALAGFTARLHTWADVYRYLGWPAGTPAYLLRGYPRMLAAAGELGRLAALATDTARHSLMLGATGGDAAALAEIAAAHALIGTSASPDLLAALRLAWHRDQLDRRNDHIPFKLPAVWATLGQLIRAEALARSIPSDHHQALALAGVAMAAAGAGDYDRAQELADRAEQIARSFTDPGWRARVLAAAAAGAGDYDRAEQIARSAAISMYDKPEILATVAAAAAGAGDYDRARELADRAERAARSITPLALQVLPLAEAAMAAAGAGDRDRARELADRAEQIARSIANPTWRSRNLAAAAAAAGDGDYDRAERVARSADPREQAQVLAEVAMAAVGAGDYDRARELADRAEQIARSITDPGKHARDLATAVALVGDYDRAEQIAQSITHPHEQARTLAEVAMAVAAAGDRDRARELADRAEQIARSITDPGEQEDILARVAAAAARAGDCDRAERIARSITHPDEQAEALAAVAAAAARAGDCDRAERIARSITDPDEQARALAEVAAEADDYDRAERIARSITHPYTQALALAGMASRISEPTRARSWIGGALAAGPWWVPLEALARTDPVALSAFISGLAASPDLPQATDNGRLSDTSVGEPLARTSAVTKSEHPPERNNRTFGACRLGVADRRFRCLGDRTQIIWFCADRSLARVAGHTHGGRCRGNQLGWYIRRRPRSGVRGGRPGAGSRAAAGWCPGPGRTRR
jgi:tetratricopeptide (TPR) repeat protein